MTRILTATCALLALLCMFQWRALRDLKAQLGGTEARAARAALVDLQGRRDEVLRVLTWIDTYARTNPASGQRDALCKNGAIDLTVIGSRLFDVYLLARAEGASEVQARQRLLQALQR